MPRDSSSCAYGMTAGQQLCVYVNGNPGNVHSHVAVPDVVDQGQASGCKDNIRDPLLYDALKVGPSRLEPRTADTILA